MVEYLFVRHGQTEWNVKELVMGRRPTPLTEEGLRQAAAASDYIKNISVEAIVTSPALRAVQTAEVIIRAHPKLKLIVDEGLNELDLGEWVGLSGTEVRSRYADAWKKYYDDPENASIPGGEKLTAAKNRVINAVLNIRKQYKSGTIVFVSHSDIIKFAIMGLCNWPMDLLRSVSMDNGAMVLLRKHPILGMRLIFFNPMNKTIRDV